MTNLDIRINIRSLESYSESMNVVKDRKTFLKVIESFAEYILKLYKYMIKEAIYSSRYKGVWEPVEEIGYIEYLGVIPETNIYHLLCDSLEVEKIGYNYFVRIDPKIKYPKTRLPLLRVIRSIENGTSKFNSRPILASITREINRNMKDLWRGYLAMRGVT